MVGLASMAPHHVPCISFSAVTQPPSQLAGCVPACTPLVSHGWRPRAPRIALVHNGFSFSVQLPRHAAWCQLETVRRYGGAPHEILANNDIPFQRVRVVDAEGLVGDYPIHEARALAQKRETDLVVLTATVFPPLCRLVDLSDYVEELDQKAQSRESKNKEERLHEFSFDPALKVKGMRFMATIDEHDLERKVNRIRSFLEQGHRVEVQILQGRAPAEDILDLSLRICAEARDIAKPEGFEDSIRGLQQAVMAPKSLKSSRKGPIEELRFRLWPCTPAQAAAFIMPAHIVGPRRRKSHQIVGLDDGPEDEDAWKLKRKPGARLSIKEQKKLNDGRPFTVLSKRDDEK